MFIISGAFAHVTQCIIICNLKTLKINLLQESFNTSAPTISAPIGHRPFLENTFLPFLKKKTLRRSAFFRNKKQTKNTTSPRLDLIVDPISPRRDLSAFLEGPKCLDEGPKCIFQMCRRSVDQSVQTHPLQDVS